MSFRWRSLVMFLAAVIATSVFTLVTGTHRASAVFPGDNGQIVFTSYRDGAANIWSMDSTGENVEQLTSGDAWDDSAAWAPDGKSIAFMSLRQVDGRIWAMDADGSDQRMLSGEVPTSSQGNPAWSLDGSQIVFTSSGGLCGNQDLWVMDADGSNSANLTNTPTCEAFDSDAEWSPFGNRIVFVSGAGGEQHIWLIDPDGSDRVNLTEDLPGSNYPSWSPLGQQIAFSNSGGIWVMDADGSNRQQLTQNVCDSTPSWSPDGSQIAFASGEMSSAAGCHEWEIHVIDLASRSVTQLTHRPGDDVSPTWQPDPLGIGLVDTASGMWRLLESENGPTSFYYGNPGDVPFMGDWNCGGIDTPGLFRTSDAYAYLRNSNSQGTADVRFFFGNPSDVPLAGDFNGDGCDTLSIYRPSEARFYIMNKLGENEGGLGAADYSFLFGNVGDKPVVGDWDGDGIDETGLHRETTGFFYYRNTLTTGVADGQLFFGDPGDRFVAGDWGVVDGIDTPGMFRPSNSTFYFRHTLTQGNADSQFTWTGAGTNWLPVSGDLTLD
jgi:Tol biopolymer transport system component